MTDTPTPTPPLREAREAIHNCGIENERIGPKAYRLIKRLADALQASAAPTRPYLIGRPPIMCEGEYSAYAAQVYPKVVPSYAEYMRGATGVTAKPATPPPEVRGLVEEVTALREWCGSRRNTLIDATTLERLLTALTAQSAKPPADVVALARELLALAEKATPGPWDFSGGSLTNWHDCMFEMEWVGNGGPDDPYHPGLNINEDADGAFMARCREAIPTLCRALLAHTESHNHD